MNNRQYTPPSARRPTAHGRLKKKSLRAAPSTWRTGRALNTGRARGLPSAPDLKPRTRQRAPTDVGLFAFGACVQSISGAISALRVLPVQKRQEPGRCRALLGALHVVLGDQSLSYAHISKLGAYTQTFCTHVSLADIKKGDSLPFPNFPSGYLPPSSPR